MTAMAARLLAAMPAKARAARVQSQRRRLQSQRRTVASGGGEWRHAASRGDPSGERRGGIGRRPSATSTFPTRGTCLRSPRRRARASERTSRAASTAAEQRAGGRSLSATPPPHACTYDTHTTHTRNFIQSNRAFRVECVVVCCPRAKARAQKSVSFLSRLSARAHTRDLWTPRLRLGRPPRCESAERAAHMGSSIVDSTHLSTHCDLIYIHDSRRVTSSSASSSSCRSHLRQSQGSNLPRSLTRSLTRSPPPDLYPRPATTRSQPRCCSLRTCGRGAG